MRGITGLTIATTLFLTACGRPPETPWGDDVAYLDRSDEVAVTVLTEDGGRVDWSWAHDVIAFDRQGDDGFFDVWTMTPDGEDARCLTCDVPGLPTRNVGQPAWHPSGEWLVVQAEKEDSTARDFAAHPGRGVQNDLWLVRSDGSEAFPLTDVPAEAGNGILHPHFSEDGETLLFSEMTAPAELDDKQWFFGAWRLVRARLVLDDGAPRLDDVRAAEPGGGGFYESHGLSPDAARWIFSANLDLEKGIGELNDIYTIDADAMDGLERLTTHGYNEHASFTPDGARVLFMSNAGNRSRGTDWWIVGVDGADPWRLTRLGSGGIGNRRLAADASWGPGGRSFVGYVQRGVGAGTGQVVRVDLPAD